MNSVFSGNLFVRGAVPIYVRTHLHNESVSRHNHDFYELVLMDSGYSMHTTDNERCILTAGDIVGIAPGKFHSYRNPLKVKIFNCVFTEAAIADSLPLGGDFPVLKLIFGRSQRLHLNAPAKQDLTRMLTRMNREFDERPAGWEMLLKGQLLALLVSVARQYALLPAPNEEKRYLSVSAVYRSLDFLEKHYASPVRLSQLAAFSGLSPDYFSRLFKEQVGLGPMEYLRILRIGRACELLAQTKLTVWEISRSVGIEDENYFARIFRRVVGQSPSAWREGDRGNVL